MGSNSCNSAFQKEGITTQLDEWKGILHPLQRMVRSYRESIHRRDEMKDDGPFWNTLSGCHTSHGDLRFRGQRQH